MRDKVVLLERGIHYEFELNNKSWFKYIKNNAEEIHGKYGEIH
jgi:hypothetical protein